MSQFILCANIFCPIKMKCFRFRKEEFEFETYDLYNKANKKKCSQFVELPKYKKIRPVQMKEKLSIYKTITISD